MWILNFYRGMVKENFYENRSIPDEYLEILSPYHLEILKNTYYALHGKKFESPEFDKYFGSQIYHKYKPRDDFKESDLSEIQIANVKKIIEYQKKLKILENK